MNLFKKDPIQIIAFSTYGTISHLYLKGRALEDEAIDLEKKGWWSVLINSWKRFETDEIRNTLLQIELSDGTKLQTTTGAEGYYLVDQSIESNIRSLLDEEGWLRYRASYVANDDNRAIQNQNCFYGEMLVPKENSSFGVISDIDDTILHTGVVSRLKWRVISNTFFKTPHNRKALEGAAEFYHMLHVGKSKAEANPIFYVSNSPWNLYLYLDFFLKKNMFPKGPILLRDFRTPFDRTPKPKLAHKYHETFNILKTYPNLKFILIGDCGEKDADIYMDVVKQLPNRIAAIYLRAVKDPKRMKRIYSLTKNYKEVPLLIVNTSKEALVHAKAHGFIV